MSFIVIAAGDASLVAWLRAVLLEQGHAIAETAPGSPLPRTLAQLEPDVTIIELEFPAKNRAKLIRAVQQLSEHALMAVTSESDPTVLAELLRAGVDDIVSPDIHEDLLGARVNALVRRLHVQKAGPSGHTVIATGDLVIDRQRRKVSRAGDLIDLTDTEYHLLDVLAERAGQTVASEVITSRLWSEASEEHNHRLRTYVGYLRRKLGDSSRRPEYIVTEWGAGYRLAVHSANESR